MHLGPTADQALNPFPNHVEQNIPRQDVCRHVESAKYAPLFEEVFGEPIDCSDDVYPGLPFATYEVNYKRIAVSHRACQASWQTNKFSSDIYTALAEAKDYWEDENPGVGLPLDPFDVIREMDSKGISVLTGQEIEGHDLFYTHCARFCHNSGPGFGPRHVTDWEFELYSSREYFNIGVPPNLEIPGYDPTKPDLGLYNHTKLDEHKGEFVTPTVRNIDKRPGKGFTKAYMHNGWFKTLEGVVHFYNTRDDKPVCPDNITTEKDALKNDCWPAPEVDENVFTGGPAGMNVGNMNLTAAQEAAIVAYMKTLTDEYTAKPPNPYK